MTEILLTFQSTERAIAAEQALLAAGLAVRVMNLPSAIRAGCGIALRLAPGDAAAATAVLAERKLAAEGLYSRVTKGGASRYAPL